MDDEKVSARFPPLTLEDLTSEKKFHNHHRSYGSMESDFDMSHSKLKYLGVDSSLQVHEPNQDVEGSV